MKAIAELIGKEIKIEEYETKKPKQELMTEAYNLKRSKVDKKYEDDLFNFLFSKRQKLEISRVIRFQNNFLDGEIETANDKKYLLEIKYRMNWMKACQAGWQISKYIQTTKRTDIAGAIVIFEKFSGDWDKKPKIRKYQNGWNHWYREHKKVERLIVDLLCYSDGQIIGYPLK